MVDVSTRPQSRSAEQVALVHEIEQFLFEDADLLDQWKLHEWLELFTTDAVYLVPATDKPDGDPSRDLFLIQDDRFLLEHRVNSLMTRSAHAEYPHSRTRRMISNVRATRTDDDRVEVAANFTIFRMRSGALDTYVGSYQHVLEDSPDGFRFIVRKSILDLDALRPHGKVSILL